ncbi:hypothetical protein ACIBCA_22740 [Kitasatospora sp. NPDC051170]|uniref:hypothetical protein n=1 Tax=Kitasatospora sp. NPDC051170 TaxID=3364056 RepID=UPI0037B575B9
MTDFPNIDTPEPVGPIWTGGFESTVVSHAGVDYTLLYLPDKHNDLLQQAGQPPVYYWVPDGVRLAEKPNGDLKFYFLHFAGVQTGSTTVGVIPGMTREITGGALSFTVTSAPPDGVLQQAHDQILGQWQDKGDRYTMYRSSAPKPTLGDPAYLRPMTVVSNNVSVTNASMNPDGSLTTGGGTDPFFWKMQGQGPGATDPVAENSFTCMMGSVAAEIVAAGLKANQSIISVVENLQVPLWAPITSLTMTSDWKRVFEHLSTAVQAKYFWAEADVKATWNDLRMQGAIKIDLEIDSTLPGADDQEKVADKYVEMLIPLWMEQAKQVIFQPMPTIPDAQAPAAGSSDCFGTGWGLGLGVSLDYRSDQVEIANSFQYQSDRRYLQPHTIGGTLDGLAGVLANDPSKLRQYFGELYLDDYDRMITVACKPGVNWPDPAKQWVGDPVDYVSVQVGYPNTSGALEWSGTTFGKPADPSAVVPEHPAAGLPAGEPGASSPSGTPSAFITFADGTTSTAWFARMTQKQAMDVTNPPDGWTPDKMFVRRSIVFNPAASDTDSPYVRQRVEVGKVDLDPGDNGTLTNELSQPVKCDHTGVLTVGPISLGGHLGGNWTAELALKPEGARLDGTSRESDVVSFTFSATDQAQPRYWTIYTGQPDYQPKFSYQVTILRNADIGDTAPPNDGWTGPWITATSGNGPLVAIPPHPGEPGVTVINPAK